MTRKESALAHVIASSDYHPRFAGWLFAHLNQQHAGHFETRKRRVVA